MNAPAAVQPPLYLVDASMYVFRAWHSLPDEFQDDEGWPVNAVHGFTRFVLELLEKYRPPRLLFAFDAALESFDSAHVALATGTGEPQELFDAFVQLRQLRIEKIETASR